MKKTRLSRRDFLFGFRRRLSSNIEDTPTSLIIEEAKQADKLLKEEDFAGAKRLLEEVIAKRKDNLVARQKLAYCYYKLGEIDKAKEEFLKLKKMGVSSNFLCLYLGLCFAHEGDLQRAISQLKGFFDITKPIIQRAINLQIALFDSNMANKEDLISSIEEAIFEQQKMDSHLKNG